MRLCAPPSREGSATLFPELSRQIEISLCAHELCVEQLTNRSPEGINITGPRKNHMLHKPVNTEPHLVDLRLIDTGSEDPDCDT